MKTEDILKELKELDDYFETGEFIHSLDLTKEQFEILAENEDREVRLAVALHPDLPEDLKYKMAEDEREGVRWRIALGTDLPEDLIIRLSCDSYWDAQKEGFEELKELNTLKSEDLENAYDIIRTSKDISRKYFEETFNYIISKFPKLSEAAKLFKSIILKGKGDLK